MLRTFATGIALVAVLTLSIAGARQASAGGGCRGEPVTDERGTVVEMTGTCFTPTILRIEPGETVTWSNAGPLPHTVTGADASWGDYIELELGDSVSHRFESPGVYPYYCLLHPGMIGGVVVGDGGAAGAETVSVQPIERPQPASEAGSTGDGGWLATAALVAAVAGPLALSTAAAGYALGRRVWR